MDVSINSTSQREAYTETRGDFAIAEPVSINSTSQREAYVLPVLLKSSNQLLFPLIPLPRGKRTKKGYSPEEAENMVAVSINSTSQREAYNSKGVILYF